jgi:hypothetical protein
MYHSLAALGFDPDYDESIFFYTYITCCMVSGRGQHGHWPGPVLGLSSTDNVQVQACFEPGSNDSNQMLHRASLGNTFFQIFTTRGKLRAGVGLGQMVLVPGCVKFSIFGLCRPQDTSLRELRGGC